MLDTFLKGIESSNAAIDRAPLNPNYRYLKVEANNQAALLVLGYQENSASKNIEIWYSAFKEVIQIQDGRLVSTQGLDVNWLDVQIEKAPSFAEFLQSNNLSGPRKNTIKFQRIRTVMPSYRASIEETVEIITLDTAPEDAPKILKSISADSPIRWVQESVPIQTNARTPYLDPVRAIYAIDTSTSEVIYGKQCLIKDYCISWLTWPYPKTSTQASLEDNIK